MPKISVLNACDSGNSTNLPFSSTYPIINACNPIFIFCFTIFIFWHIISFLIIKKGQ